LLTASRALWVFVKTSPPGNAHRPAPGNRLNLRSIPICRSATDARDAVWCVTASRGGNFRDWVVRPRSVHAPDEGQSDGGRAGTKPGVRPSVPQPIGGTSPSKGNLI
jgi:hypothetical protein